MAAQVGCPSVPVAGQICDAVVGGAKDVVSAPFQFAGDQLAKWLVGGVSDAGTAVVQGLGHVLDSSTTPNLGASWFLGNYNMVLGIASVVVALTFMIQIVSSLIRREPGMIGRAVTGSLIGVVGAFAILAICQAALLGTDELCNGLLSASGTGSMSSSLTKMWGTAVADLGPGAWFLAVFLGVLFIIGAFMLWVAMFLREISIYVLAVFAPIAFAGYGWDRTRTWLRRWGEIVAALIFSKLVIYIVFLLGLSMIGNAGAASGVTGSITQLIGGTCLLLLGALAPWATHRFISFAGNATGDMSEHGSPKGASGAGMMMGVTSAMAVGKTVGGGIVGGPGGAAAGAAGGSQQTAQAAGNAGSPAPGATGGTSGGASTPPGGSGGGASPAPASSGGGGGSAPAPPPAPSSTSSGGGGGNSSPAPSGGGSSGGGGGGSSAGGAGGGAAAGVGVP